MSAPNVVQNVDPCSGEKLGTVPAMTRDEDIVRNQMEICRYASKDSGKTLTDANLGEVWPVCEKIKYLIKHGENDLKHDPRGTSFFVHKRAWVQYMPLGVVGVICPFNFPFHNIFCPLVPALFAGNGVVLKISEHTSYSLPYYASFIHRALQEEGFSVDLVQFVTGFGETGAALVGSGVDKVFFTGSPYNGQKVMAEASKTLTPVVLELGGKDPLIVCEDADFEQALAASMLGILTACGQMCVGSERIYVHEKLYERFVAEAVRRVKTMKQGCPLKERVDVGASTMPRQLEILETLVNDALAKGAVALVGGKRNAALPQGNFWEPTVLVNVNHSMRIMKEEHFGPVMVIMKFANDDEAVRLANDCPFGLGSSVFTKNLSKARWYIDRLVSGMTVVNDYGVAYICQSLPFGGVKISGIGRINGREGLRECCITKAVLTDRFPGIRVRVPRAFQYPVQPERAWRLSESSITALYSDSIIEKAKAGVQMIRATLSRL